MAFVVVDAWQGRGVGSILMRHLVKIASDAGLKELTAEVLPENTAMIKVFGKFGFKPAPRRDPQTIHLVRKLALSLTSNARATCQRAVTTVPGLVPANEAAGISRRVAPLSLQVIAPCSEIEPDDRVPGAMALRLGFIAKWREALCYRAMRRARNNGQKAAEHLQKPSRADIGPRTVPRLDNSY